MSKKPDVGLFARGWDDEQLQQQLEHQRERLRRAEALQARAPSSLGTDEIQLFHSLNATQRLVSRLSRNSTGAGVSAWTVLCVCSGERSSPSLINRDPRRS